jgi:hypothetical protein
MTTTRRAAQLDPRPFGLATAAVALVLASGIIVAALGSIGFGGGQGRDPVQLSPYVIASARLWELQRVQQSPYITWAMRSAHEWEKQRLQQSPFDPA